METILFKNAKDCAKALIMQPREYPLNRPWEINLGMENDDFPEENKEKAINYIEKALIKKGYTAIIEYGVSYDDWGMGGTSVYVTFKNIKHIPKKFQKIQINNRLYPLTLIDDLGGSLPDNAKIVTIFNEFIF